MVPVGARVFMFRRTVGVGIGALVSFLVYDAVSVGLLDGVGLGSFCSTLAVSQKLPKTHAGQKGASVGALWGRGCSPGLEASLLVDMMAKRESATVSDHKSKSAADKEGTGVDCKDRLQKRSINVQWRRQVECEKGDRWSSMVQNFFEPSRRVVHTGPHPADAAERPGLWRHWAGWPLEPWPCADGIMTANLLGWRADLTASRASASALGCM